METEDSMILSKCRAALIVAGIDPDTKAYKIVHRFDVATDGHMLPADTRERIQRQYSADQLAKCSYYSRSPSLGGAGFFVIDHQTGEIVAKYLGR